MKRSSSTLKYMLTLIGLLILMGGQTLSVFAFSSGEPVAAQETRTFVIGLSSKPRSIDPAVIQLLPDLQLMDAYLEPMWKFIDSDDLYNLENRLGLDFIQVDDYTVEIPLRQGVLFHDGTPFNASAVKWNWDRFLFNIPRAPGTEPARVDADKFMELIPGLDLNWVPYSEDPSAPIARPVCVINNTYVKDEFTVQVNLNVPLGADAYDFVRGMGMAIISPTAHAEYWNQQIPLSEIVIGTGPFKMISYDEIGLSAHFEAFDDYWRGRPMIDDLYYQVYLSADAMDVALFTGDIDFTYGVKYTNLESVEANADLSVLDAGVGRGTLCFSLNTLPGHIDLPMRKALSYAFPYEYIIDETVGGQGVRYGRPIPLGKMWDNTSLPYPTENLTLARQIIIDAGKAPSDAQDHINDDAYWIAIAESSNPIGAYNMPTLNGDNTEWIRIVMPSAWKKIGVKCITWEMTYEEFYPAQQVDNKTENDILYQDWADFNPDPTSFLRGWYGTDQSHNFANYHDEQIDDWLDQIYLAGTVAEKRDLVYQIQSYIAENAFAYINVLQVKQFNAYRSSQWANVTPHYLYQADFYWVHHVDDVVNSDDDGTSDDGTSDDDSTGEGDIEIPGYSSSIIVGLVFISSISLWISKKRKLKQ